MVNSAPTRGPGSRPGALVLHGFTSTTASMQPVADALADADIDVEMPLLPGHGTHWQDLAATRAETILEAVAAAHDRLAARCATVVPVGLSMGGALALWSAARTPGSGGAPSPGVVVINPGLRLAPMTGAAAAVLGRFRPTLPAIAGDIAKDGVVEEAYEQTPLRGVVQLDRLFARSRKALPLLRERGTAVMLLRSPRDAVVGSRSAQLLKKRLAPGQVTEVILRRSGHVATLDWDADLLQRRTVGFIQSVHVRDR
ncbi:alpha/beta hydrolase [Nesterenkonia flava]|uniref:Alpha/beta fold hydrolase n=1 Tax=Nesterenkonia flava TaxID=469799 RepID=A0ABU1FWD8_9MICC|nr:alpha/beta fold hydrolase [Nesterenkonia flava]MDR5713000.1 alpha/beta fold hydrolase [Nesterenkonia flava]